MISIKNKNILGLSLLEALVSTAIIGIGFVSILQMTNYSVQSMQTSGERTKANFLTSVIAEDVISSRESSTTTHSKFSHFLISEQIKKYQLMVMRRYLVQEYVVLLLEVDQLIQIKFTVRQKPTRIQ